MKAKKASGKDAVDQDWLLGLGARRINSIQGQELFGASVIHEG